MANVKISNLTAATTPVAGTEVLPIVQSGATVKVSIANLTAGRAVSVLSLTSTNDSTISGLTVGKGAGAVATNTAVGASALATNTTGANNTFLGWSSGYYNTTGSSNVAVGSQAYAQGGSSATGSFNVAIGQLALSANTTASYNTAVGYRALYANTTGELNTAVGLQAAQNNTTGSGLAAIGQNALVNNTTGAYNTALGKDALLSNTTASNNTAVGYQAGYSNTTGTNNTFLGQVAGRQGNGTYNTFIGDTAGYNTSGTLNALIGQGAGYLITSGSKNTVIGSYGGNQGGLDIRTASNYIVLSDGDGNPRASWATSGTFTSRNTNGRNFQWDGSEVYIDVDNTVTLGFPSFRWTVVYATTGTINTSDANTKQDIAALDDAEKRVAIAIKSLIKKYRFKDAVAKKGDAARIHVGVVAQEVQAAFVAEGLDPARYALFCSDTWYEVDGKPASEASTPFTQNTPNAIEVTRLGIRYDELLAFVIAAL
jgi:hypothetical protein